MGLRPRGVTKAGGSLVGLLFIGSTSGFAAEPTERLALSWNGPPGCPTAENVQARVNALLGGGASASSVADVRASGQVERVDSGFRLLLTMGVGSTPSSRVIEAHTCDELAGAAAIAIALLARSTVEGASAPSTGDDTSLPSASNGHGEPPPATPQTRATASSNKEPEPLEEPPPTRLHLSIDAPTGVASWGLLPSAGLGVGVALGIRWKALRAAAGGALWQPQEHRDSAFATRFTLQSGQIEACLIEGIRGLELGPCLGAAVQRLAGEGIGSDVLSPKSRTAVWLSGLGGLFASVPTPGFARLRLYGAASVLVSPVRPRFVIDQLGPVHEPLLAAPRLDLGCEWIF
jgi:hypothetical protein